MTDELLSRCELFCDAAAKKTKLDPKAKVRNRGDVVFSAESKSVNDHADHYPIGSEDQARNAWSRAHQYSESPPWYNGSLKSLQEAVKRKMHSKYPGIEFEKTKKTAALKEQIDTYIDRVIHYTSMLKHISDKNTKYLQALKSEYAVGFDPELEHTIVEAMPDMEGAIVSVIRMMDDNHKRISDMIRRAKDTAALPQNGPISG